MCFNRKVIGGLAVVALGVFLLAPGLRAAALPVLIVLACPLSMLVMMWGMSRHRSSSTPQPVEDDLRAENAALQERLRVRDEGAPRFPTGGAS